jgi:hypothetical protein
MSESDTDHWQVVEITGVGIGEMWFDVVAEDLSQETAEQRADQRDRYVAVPMPYDPDIPPEIGQVVDDYNRQVIDQ